MPTQQITNGTPPVVEPTSPVGGEDEVRELAIKQIERKRHFQMRAFVGAMVSVLLVIIWVQQP